MSEISKSYSFDSLVQHGLVQCRSEGRESNIVNGMPWSFTVQGLAVTHENDRCYLMSGLCVEPGDVLTVTTAATVVKGTK